MAIPLGRISRSLPSRLALGFLAGVIALRAEGVGEFARSPTIAIAFGCV